MLKGFASTIKTKAISEKYSEFQYKLLGKTGLSVSGIGFGAYRIHNKSLENKEALEKALLTGINLIDTSSTYTDGHSEMLIGDILDNLVKNKMLSRESVVIVSKAGYLQGQNYKLSQLRKNQNNIIPDLIEYQEGLEHCIHPSFLKEQITKSLKRLKLKSIDVYLLHNPEYYLKWAKNNNIDIESARNEYYSRIKQAFQYLEEEVKAGRIKYYGISSNTFPLSSSSYEFTSLEKVIQIACEVSENNHFGVIEFPMNLFETGAQFNEENALSLLQLAQNNNLGVLINRPLNAIYDNKVIKLAEPLDFKVVSEQEIEKTLEKLKVIETSITEKLAYSKNPRTLKISKTLDTSSTDDLPNTNDRKTLENLKETLFVYEELYGNWLKAKNITSWQNTLNRYFLPPFYYYIENLKNSLCHNQLIREDLIDYEAEISILFDLISNYYNYQHKKLTDKIKQNLFKTNPEWNTTTKLSNLAIRALRTTEGISSVLSGMTKPLYVLDAIEELKTPITNNFDWSKIISPKDLLR